MGPYNLQGLNIVHPPQEFPDSQDLLAYPDLSAQLDLWSNLNFDFDETYLHRHGFHGDVRSSSTAEEMEEGTRSTHSSEEATRDGLPPLATSMTQLLAHPHGATSNPLTAAEEKRRRNTAASARFRLKKKEREAALEGRTKELETKVRELERECEGLRRENGWLRGLVVGVTGAAAQGSNPSQRLTAESSPPATYIEEKRNHFS